MNEKTFLTCWKNRFILRGSPAVKNIPSHFRLHGKRHMIFRAFISCKHVFGRVTQLCWSCINDACLQQQHSYVRCWILPQKGPHFPKKIMFINISLTMTRKIPFMSFGRITLKRLSTLTRKRENRNDIKTQ